MQEAQIVIDDTTLMQIFATLLYRRIGQSSQAVCKLLGV